LTTGPTDTAQEFLTTETVGPYLVDRGVFSPADDLEIAELGGGVSNIVLRAESTARAVVLKQALPRLRVAEEWLAKRERAINEAEALRLLGGITPDHLPELIDLDRERCALVTSAAPAGWTSWKERLLGGHADPQIARSLGEILARWHATTLLDGRVRALFPDTVLFDQLRVDPYYRATAAHRLDLAGHIEGYVERMQHNRLCLVHGDFSPKNVLVGDGIWVIDFEVAHVGDPVFDVAFMLNHLLLKRVHLPGSRGAEESVRAFWAGYEGAVPEALLPDRQYLHGQLGCLMVARVEGKSPVEYLSDRERVAVAELGSSLLRDPPDSIDAVLGLVAASLA
jgi:5-methylthioribose kinase